MMELDKRIANIANIFSVNDGCHDYKFMNKKGYFANRITDFQDLNKKCVYGEYTDYREQDKCFSCRACSNGVVEYDWFTYFIPEKDLKPIEPEYRPFTIKEFQDTFKIGQTIKIRQKDDTEAYQLMLIGYIPFLNHKGTWIVLGDIRFSLELLFKNYDLYVPSIDWYVPFGIKE